MGRRKVPVELRFWNKVEKTQGCWNWTAYKDSHGYGRILVDGVSRLAHRVAYVIMGYTIPEGLTMDHLCRNTSCVNPQHLEPVTQTENIRRGESPAAIHMRKA